MLTKEDRQAGGPGAEDKQAGQNALKRKPCQAALKGGTKREKANLDWAKKHQSLKYEALPFSTNKNAYDSWVWRYRPLFPTLLEARQEDSKFKPSLDKLVT